MTGQGGRFEPDTKEMNRTAYILERLFSQILDGDFEPVDNLCRYGRGDADAADVGQLLDPRSNIHTITKNILLVKNDVAEVDPDPEFDPPILRHVRITPLHTLLDLHGALYRIRNALEFDKHAVTRGLNDVTLVLRDRGVHQFDSVSFQAGERACFIHLHQPAVACHVGRQDRG
ncbi:hypothetical protein AJ87_43985 [Rhizobium yanglingense]|nr:hypothetical protein AJ87_43985 [Rhizobium yanglingense]